MTFPSVPSRVVAFAAAACAGAMAWLSLGSLAVASSTAASSRLGLLPHLWLLPLFVFAFVALAWMTRLWAGTTAPLFASAVLVLPWLPFEPPDAFLLWTGHIVVAVWIAVAVSMVIANDVRVPRVFGDTRLAPRIAALVACVLFIASGVRLAGLLPGGDEPHYLIITQSLLKDGDLQIENNHKQGDYREYFAGSLPPDFLKRGTNEQIYSVHAPGLPVVVAPAYALFGYRGVSVFLAIVAALGTALLWRAGFLLTGSAGAAWFGWAAGALTVPFFFQSFAVYPDAVGATIVLFATLPLFEPSVDSSKVRWLAIGSALSLLPWLHTRFALLAGTIGIVLLLRLVRTRDDRALVVPLLSVPLASAFAWFGFFYAVYGTINPAAPYGGYTQSEPANILNGFPALLLDQQFGVLAYAPVYAVCLAGMVTLARRQPRLAAEVTFIAIPYALVTSMYHMWWAGNSSPARFLVVLLPLLAIPGAWIWRETRYTSTRAMALALLLLSVAITLSLAVVDRGRLVYNFRDGYSLAAERLSALVDLPRGLPSFFRQSPAGASVRALIWIAGMSAVFLGLRFAEWRSTQAVRTRLAIWTPVGLALAAMLSLTIVWRLDGVPGASAAASQLDLLSTYDSRTRPTGVLLSPMAIEPAAALLSKIAITTSTRRPSPPPGTLLLAPGLIPAGEYALRATGGGTPAGTAGLIIGRDARPIQTWDLGVLRQAPIRFELPVPVGSLVVSGDGDAARGGSLELVPIRIDDSSTGDYARRAQSYGPASVFFFDDAVFPEEPGFWVRGGRTARVAIAPPASGRPVSLLLRNAPVDNVVAIDIDGQRHDLDLQPREERVLPLAIGRGRRAVRVSVQAPNGFHPSEVEPGSTDNRFLGVWIQVQIPN